MRYLSLCSGIEAATVAWAPLGWTPVAFADTDHYCRAFLEHTYPTVPNLGDLAKITARQIEDLGPIDLVVGGTPCQDLSIAGQRRGLHGSRSSLFFEYVRIVHAARRLCGARFALWENVPGALTNRRGRDFAVVVSELAGHKFEPPSNGWGNEGLALGRHGLVEWGVLDAQWFGLAQRRERLFALVDSGNWQGRAPVLLEPESMRGDSPPSRAPGARTSGTITPSAFSGSSACGGDGRDGMLVDELEAPDVAAPLTHGGHPGSNAPGRRREDDENLVAAAICARGNRYRTDETYVAGPLLSNSNGHGWRTGAEEAAGNHYIVDDIAEPLTSRNARNATHAGNNARPRNVVACFDETQLTHPENRSTCSPETAALAKTARPPAIAEDDDGSSSGPGVRRLTPTECERLMGVPDGYTRIPYRPRRRRLVRPASDTVRYAALGNAIATTQLRWIGRKLQEVLAHGQT
jgi:DNA (cytosine-5)-methyltransferase 1